MGSKYLRIPIPPEFRENFRIRQAVKFCYSPEEKLFFVIPEGTVCEEFFITTQILDDKYRLYVPKQMMKCYKDLKNILVAEKNGKLYLLPILGDSLLPTF